MSTLYEFMSMSIEEKRSWEIAHSSLVRLKKANYEECRSYACRSITDGLTKIPVSKGEIVEIPYGVSFNFIARVDTSKSRDNSNRYYKTYVNRDFISYSTICNENISHYRGSVLLAYNVYPEDIVHIFPMDSDTRKYADKEEELTSLPSLWFSLQDLNGFSSRLRVYNQVTIKTKRNGQIYKPSALIAIEQTSDEIQKIADAFEVGTIILHPNKDAAHYNGDLLFDYYKLENVSAVMEDVYGFSVTSMFYDD